MAMVELDQKETAVITVGLHSREKELLSTTNTMKKTGDWSASSYHDHMIFLQEIPSDITVDVGGTTFSLHKFPLMSKSGYIRKLVSESNDTDLPAIEIPDVPGGAAAFELAAKFCYGINFEISIENVALIRCVAEHLEMTEDYAVGNLIGRTEAYLNEVAFKSFSCAISVLHSSENLLPVAEKVKLVSRCIDAIAYLACKDSQFTGQCGIEGGYTQLKPIVDWWAEDLTVLSIDFFQRVLVAMIARGLKQYALGPVLMLYAQKSLRGLEVFGKGRNKTEPREEHEKRVVLETIVSLLPREMNALSVSFLSMLLRSSIYLETTVACRLDLEKRMALQLGQAVLDDLLIPSYSFTGDTLFDVDTVKRIMMNYLQVEMDRTRTGYNVADYYVSPPPGDFERVGKLMENYLAEIASDRNLSVSKFIGLAELIPEQSRVTEDGIYRAIDIFLKAHPSLSDMDRKKICSLMDCQKLTREACAHAAQNDRLPVQTVVQVLYYEQRRLREAMGGNLTGGESPVIPRKASLSPTESPPVSNELVKLRRENEGLKIELLKLKMRLKELEKSAASNSPTTQSPAPSIMSTADKPPLPRKSFMNSVSKKLGRLYPFVGAASTLNPKGRTKPSRDRRHSIS
ncbi:BTB/POZ domain-containing protein sr1ip1, variant 2 [Dionaea muscipula]